MQRLDKKSVEDVMSQHKVWINTKGKDGACADLSKSNMDGLDLSMFNFTGADLMCCSVSGCVFNHTVLLAHTKCTELNKATII